MISLQGIYTETHGRLQILNLMLKWTFTKVNLYLAEKLTAHQGRQTHGPRGKCGPRDGRKWPAR